MFPLNHLNFPSSVCKSTRQCQPVWVQEDLGGDPDVVGRQKLLPLRERREGEPARRIGLAVVSMGP